MNTTSARAREGLVIKYSNDATMEIFEIVITDIAIQAKCEMHGTRSRAYFIQIDKRHRKFN